jgi:hypothetical protein
VRSPLGLAENTPKMLFLQLYNSANLYSNNI